MTQTITLTIFSTNLALVKGGRWAEILWLARNR